MKDNLSHEDWNKWIQDTIIYCAVPTIIAYLTALQAGSFQFALGAAQTALIASALNLFGRYKSGIEGGSNEKPGIDATNPSIEGSASSAG